MDRKRILSVVLTLCFVFSSVLCVQAVDHRPSKVKIGFNGKTVTFNAKSEPKTLSQLEKKWGKRTRVGDEGEYIWEKGETTLTVDVRYSGKELGSVSAEINDENASVAGVSVGMEKYAAMKKLQDVYGTKSVVEIKKGQDWDFFGEDSYIVVGRPSSDEEHIYVLRGHFYPIYFDLTDGKVSGIQWTRL